MILLDMAVKVLSLPLYHKISFNKRTKNIITQGEQEEEKVEEHFCHRRSLERRSEKRSERGEERKAKAKFFKARNHLLKPSKLK
jgi:hypothetical protein